MSIELNQSPNFIRLNISGKITRDAITRLEPQLERALENRRSNLLIDLRQLQEASAAALIEDLRLQHRFRERLNRVAVLGAPRSIQSFLDISEEVVGRDAAIQAFQANQEEEAEEWLED